MINIITGPRNSGKSSRFLRLYRESESKEIGLFSLKRLDLEGYDLCLLPGEETLPLARLSIETYCLTEEDYIYQGRFVFSRLAFDYATTYILKRLPSSPTTIWIDEVGKLELQGAGYSFLLRRLLEEQINVTLTIRDRYLPLFLSTYQVDKYLIL